MKQSCMILLSLTMGLMCISCRSTKTLFMVGDSTMADKSELIASHERGWGQLFATYMDSTKVKIQNHAKNGRSTRSYLNEGRWDEVMKRIKKGDVVIIEFGHNDTKPDAERHSTVEEYKLNLSRMVNDARAKGAIPVLATSIVRRQFENGQVKNTHGNYPEAMREVARLLDVPVLDLNKTSTDWLQSLGDESSKAYYMNVEPGKWSKFPNGKTDDTHLKEAGALDIGLQAVQEIERLNLQPLIRWIVPEGKRKTAYTTPCGIK